MPSLEEIWEDQHAGIRSPRLTLIRLRIATLVGPSIANPKFGVIQFSSENDVRNLFRREIVLNSLCLLFCLLPI